MKTVSVIMPIYDAGELLQRSLGQLAAQTLQNMEYILVDDCSNDTSYEIAEDFKNKYPEQTVLLKTEVNSGPGGARNLGLSCASGEYIGFMDADDEIVPQMFQMLYEKALEEDADIVDSGYYNEKLDYAMLHISDDLTGILDNGKRSQLIVSGGYIVTKIFRRSFVKEQKFSFRENVSLEDSEFITKAFATAGRVANIKEIFYKYSFTDYSASRERDAYQYYKNVIGAMLANYQAVCDLQYYGEIQMSVEYLITQLYSYGVLKCLSVCTMDNYDRILEYLKKIREIKRDTVRYGYEENNFVMQKISDNDIQVMKLNDKEPKELLDIVLHNKEN